MDVVLAFLGSLNSLSPLAVIALLGLVLFYQAKNKDTSKQAISNLTDNHLHEVVEILQRIETAQAVGFATLIAQSKWDNR